MDVPEMLAYNFVPKETIFDNTGAVIKTKTSSNGKYTSLSIEVNLDSSDAVIHKYKEVSAVEGVISL